MNLDFFDWRWSDEASTNKYQLIIERNYQRGFYKLEDSNLVYRDSEGKDCSYSLYKCLNKVFNDAFSNYEATEISELLDYHFHQYQGEPISFLKHIRTVIISSHNTNAFELNFDGKKEVGLIWVEEAFQDLNSTIAKKSLSGIPNQRRKVKKSLDDIFNKKAMTKEEFMTRLRFRGYIDDDNIWRKEKADLLGLMRCLIEQTNFITVKKYATLQNILATEIHFELISKPSQPIFEDYIEQYKKVFPEAYE